MSLASAVCFIACHGGAANDFVVQAKELTSKGHTVRVFATGPALKVFQDRNISNVHEFSLEEEKEYGQIAREIAKKCQKAAAVIMDVGHIFDVFLQEAFAEIAPGVMRIAYYDNHEPYVPGGYSAIASKVMLKAHRTLFANANLVNARIYETPSKEVPLSQDSKIGLGYYSLEPPQEIARKRENEQSQIRMEFFSQHNMIDKGQKVFVYAGGNNETYFSEALPACLEFFGDLSAKEDLSDVIFVLQQHPGAKAKNIDANLVTEWLKNNEKSGSCPKIIISDMDTDSALVLADAMFYYQTSMGPKFVLAGIPTVQIGHECYEDILVKNKFCQVVNSKDELSKALQTLKENESKISSQVVEGKLGIHSDWSERLQKAVSVRLNENQTGESSK